MYASSVSLLSILPRYHNSASPTPSNSASHNPEVNIIDGALWKIKIDNPFFPGKDISSIYNYVTNVEKVYIGLVHTCTHAAQLFKMNHFLCLEFDHQRSCKEQRPITFFMKYDISNILIFKIYIKFNITPSIFTHTSSLLRN